MKNQRLKKLMKKIELPTERDYISNSMGWIPATVDNTLALALGRSRTHRTQSKSMTPEHVTQSSLEPPKSH